VAENLDNNYIAQEFIAIQKKIIPLYENNSIVEKELYFDICPHIFIKEGEIF
jgi:hypothetical protein